MREIADLRAGALDHVAIGLDEQVQLARQRREIARKNALDLLVLAAADRRHAVLQSPQRAQAVAQLHGGGGDEDDGQHGEGNEQRQFEARHLRLDLVGRRGDLNEVDALVAGIDDPLDHAQRPVVGPGGVAAPRAPHAGLDAEVGEPRQAGGEQGARGADVRARAVLPGDLPVPARQRQLELRVAEVAGVARLRIAAFGVVRLVGGDVGDERAKIDAEPLVEGGLGRRAVDGPRGSSRRRRGSPR